MGTTNKTPPKLRRPIEARTLHTHLCSLSLYLCVAAVLHLDYAYGQGLRGKELRHEASLVEEVDGGPQLAGARSNNEFQAGSERGWYLSATDELDRLTFNVVSACIPGPKLPADQLALVRANREAYVQKRGTRYRLVWSEERRVPQLDPRWEKVVLLQQSLGLADWTFWLDCDALIMNHDIDLVDILRAYGEENTQFVGGPAVFAVRRDRPTPVFAPDELVVLRAVDGAALDGRYGADLLITQDAAGLNSGSFLLRNSPWSHKLLADVFGRAVELDQQQSRWRDQQALILELSSRQGERTHVAIAPQRSINSYAPLDREWNSSRTYSAGDFVMHRPGCTGHGCWGVLKLYAYFDEHARKPQLVNEALRIAVCCVGVAVVALWLLVWKYSRHCPQRRRPRLGKAR